MAPAVLPVKMNPKMFTHDSYPLSSHWKIIKGDDAIKIYNSLVEKEINLKKIINKGLLCVQDKKLSCLKTFLRSADYDIYHAANMLWKYTNLTCDQSIDYNVDYDHFGGVTWDEEIIIPWSSLENIFLGKITSNDIKILTKDFGKIDRIDIETSEDTFCKGKAKKSTRISYENKNYISNGGDTWEILFWGFTKKLSE